MAAVGNGADDTGNYQGIFNVIKGILITMPEAGTITSVDAFVFNNGTPGSWQVGIYTSGGTLLASSNVRTNIAGSPPYNFDGLSLAVNASDQIIVAIAADGIDDSPDNGISYSAAGTYDGRSTDVQSNNVDPMPGSATFNADSSRDYELNVNYTPGGGGGAGSSHSRKIQLLGVA